MDINVFYSTFTNVFLFLWRFLRFFNVFLFCTERFLHLCHCPCQYLSPTYSNCETVFHGSAT